MSDATKTGPTSLLDLPGELRDQILEYVVGDHIIEFENCPWLAFQDQRLRDDAHPQHIIVTKITKITSLLTTIDHEKNLDYPSVNELDPLSNKEFIGLADTNWLAEDTACEEPGLSKLADTYHTYSLALSRVRRDCSSPPLPCASTFLNSLLTSRQIYNEVSPILYGSNMFSFTLNCEFLEDGGDSLCLSTSSSDTARAPSPPGSKASGSSRPPPTMFIPGGAALSPVSQPGNFSRSSRSLYAPDLGPL